MSAAVSIEVSLVLGVWQRDVRHLSRSLGRVLVELDLAEDIFCCAHCPQILRLLSLRFHFPLLSIFLVFCATLIHVSLFFISFPFVSSVSSGLRKSFISTPHLLFGLPTGLFVWCLVLRPGFHFAPFFAHRSSGNDWQFSLPIAISFFCAFQSSM